MSETTETDAGPPRHEPGVAEAETALETEHERYLNAARARTNAIADRLARAAGYPGALRPGGIVRLKSGSPPMTIACVDIVDGLVYCHYFWRGGPGQARYSAEMLEPCEPVPHESFVPPAKPGACDPWERSARSAREDSPGNPGGVDKPARAPRNKSQKPKVNLRAHLRAPREPEPEELALQQRRESDRVWRETMRRIARLKRLAREREKRLREDQETDRGAAPQAAPAPEDAACAPVPAAGDAAGHGSGES